MSESNYISIKGAKVNNLKNIDVNIPRNKLVVITGLSGSGKSSLAFDTLYAEGQRRYVESLSSYARQFLGRMSKPECDFIKGILPQDHGDALPHGRGGIAAEAVGLRRQRGGGGDGGVLPGFCPVSGPSAGACYRAGAYLLRRRVRRAAAGVYPAG